MPSHVIDFGRNAYGIHEKVIVDEDRVTVVREQSSEAEDLVMKRVHEANRDGFRRKAAWRPFAEVPYELREKWRNEWMGKRPGQRHLASAPCKDISWPKFMQIKLSSPEYARLRYK